MAGPGGAEVVAKAVAAVPTDGGQAAVAVGQAAGVVPRVPGAQTLASFKMPAVPEIKGKLPENRRIYGDTSFNSLDILVKNILPEVVVTVLGNAAIQELIDNFGYVCMVPGEPTRTWWRAEIFYYRGLVKGVEEADFKSNTYRAMASKDNPYIAKLSNFCSALCTFCENRQKEVHPRDGINSRTTNLAVVLMKCFATIIKNFDGSPIQTDMYQKAMIQLDFLKRYIIKAQEHFAGERADDDFLLALRTASGAVDILLDAIRVDYSARTFQQLILAEKKSAEQTIGDLLNLIAVLLPETGPVQFKFDDGAGAPEIVFERENFRRVALELTAIDGHGGNVGVDEVVGSRIAAAKVEGGAGGIVSNDDRFYIQFCNTSIGRMLVLAVGSVPDADGITKVRCGDFVLSVPGSVPMASIFSEDNCEELFCDEGLKFENDRGRDLILEDVKAFSSGGASAVTISERLTHDEAYHKLFSKGILYCVIGGNKIVSGCKVDFSETRLSAVARGAVQTIDGARALEDVQKFQVNVVRACMRMAAAIDLMQNMEGNSDLFGVLLCSRIPELRELMYGANELLEAIFGKFLPNLASEAAGTTSSVRVDILSKWVITHGNADKNKKKWAERRAAYLKHGSGSGGIFYKTFGSRPPQFDDEGQYCPGDDASSVAALAREVANIDEMISRYARMTPDEVEKLIKDTLQTFVKSATRLSGFVEGGLPRRIRQFNVDTFLTHMLPMIGRCRNTILDDRGRVICCVSDELLSDVKKFIVEKNWNCSDITSRGARGDYHVISIVDRGFSRSARAGEFKTAMRDVLWKRIIDEAQKTGRPATAIGRNSFDPVCDELISKYAIEGLSADDQTYIKQALLEWDFINLDEAFANAKIQAKRRGDVVREHEPERPLAPAASAARDEYHIEVKISSAVSERIIIRFMPGKGFSDINSAFNIGGAETKAEPVGLADDFVKMVGQRELDPVRVALEGIVTRDSVERLMGALRRARAVPEAVQCELEMKAEEGEDPAKVRVTLLPGKSLDGLETSLGRTGFAGVINFESLVRSFIRPENLSTMRDVKTRLEKYIIGDDVGRVMLALDRRGVRDEGAPPSTPPRTPPARPPRGPTPDSDKRLERKEESDESGPRPGTAPERGSGGRRFPRYAGPGPEFFHLQHPLIPGEGPSAEEKKVDENSVFILDSMGGRSLNLNYRFPDGSGYRRGFTLGDGISIAARCETDEKTDCVIAELVGKFVCFKNFDDIISGIASCVSHAKEQLVRRPTPPPL